MAEERYYKHDGVERFTHWAHLADTVVLILSGLQIRYPGFSVFGTMQAARFLHLVSGYFFFLLGVLHVYFFFALGKRKIAMPHAEDLSGIGPVLKYYLVVGGTKPDYAKYNALQKFAYAALFAVSFFQSILGFALYWPVPLAAVLSLFGGAVDVRILHTTVMWIFLSFTAVHVYLVFTEDARLVKAMVDGYYYRKVPEGKGM
ncbi:MAG: Ni/Fe-hydrogenase, b-type cytochrome subunit [Deltaproteobacteria bacterium]